jgi:hypothetical protein
MSTATVTEMATVTATAIAMATAMAMATITKGGVPIYVPVMCSAVVGVTPCLHPHGHKGKCIHQRYVMGVTLLTVFAYFQGGGGCWRNSLGLSPMPKFVLVCRLVSIGPVRPNWCLGVTLS